MKVVCDTNVLVSGILFGGHARDILQLASRGTISNYISPDILQEIEEVLLRPKFRLKADQVNSILQLIKDSFEMVYPSARVIAVKADPYDNQILEAAWAAKAEFVISGDKHLLDLERWHEIRMISPADFIQMNIREIIGSAK